MKLMEPGAMGLDQLNDMDVFELNSFFYSGFVSFAGFAFLVPRGPSPASHLPAGLGHDLHGFAVPSDPLRMPRIWRPFLL